MTKIQKLNQTFVAGTEATAASQNLQSNKIDEVIDAFTIADGTVALPVTKSGTAYKVTAIGTGLSVSGNTLNGTTYTLPMASSSSLGGIKIGTGLSIDSNGIVSATGTGGVSQSQVDTTVANAIGALDVSSVGGSGKYIQSISEVDGKISAVAANMTATTLDSANGVHTLKYGTTSLLVVNDNTQLMTIGGDTYFLLKVGATVYYTLNDGARSTLSGGSLAISNSQHITKVTILVPAHKSLTVRDSNSTDVTASFVESGLTIVNGTLCTKYIYATQGSYIGQTYTITIS